MDTTTTSLAAGKRKAINADDHQTTPSMFALVPDDCWHLVSSFANPPDAYNLSLSSKHFFRPTTTSGEEESSSTTPLLATRLLRQSLLSSLGRVLEHSQSGITLESALALADLPEGSALIAGSTMAQACLGVLWKSRSSYQKVDVDVYCSAQAAPRVRSWLVEQACLFVGFKDYNITIDDDRLLYTVDTKIHHVEIWGSVIENLEGIEAKGGSDLETLKNTEYYKYASEWGKNCQKNYVDNKWHHPSSMYFEILGVDQNRTGAYNIKPKPGGDLPFDFDGYGSIDLIVARMNTEGGASSLLEDFDLTICKASFDGKHFRIPDPHRTFSAKSTMEPNRAAVVESYVKHFKSPSKKYLGEMAASALASTTIKAVRKDVPNAPFYRQLDFAARLPDRYTGTAMWGDGSLSDPLVKAKYGSSTQFHNWTVKLINRLRKYQQRGIEVGGAPTIGDDVQIKEFSFMWF